MRLDGFKIQTFEFLTEDQAYVTFWRIVLEDSN